MELVMRIDVSIRRAIQVLGITLQRMRAELLDQDTNWRSQPLRPEGVGVRRSTVDVGAWGQAVENSGLVAGDQGLGTEDRCRRAGDYGDARAV